MADEDETPFTGSSAALFIGGAMVFTGLTLLTVAVMPGLQTMWPLLVVFAGAALLVIGTTGRYDRNTAPAGGIVMVVGFVLGVQTVIGGWSAWAYLWPLIFVGFGVGGLAYHITVGDQNLRQRSERAILAGTIVSFGGFVFFEIGIGLNNITPEAGVTPVLGFIFLLVGGGIVIYVVGRLDGDASSL